MADVTHGDALGDWLAAFDRTLARMSDDELAARVEEASRDPLCLVLVRS